MPTTVLGETGGAIYNAGPLELDGVVFRENAAEDGGLAIYNLLPTAVLNNLTFAGNILTCSSETYSYTKDVSAAFVPLPRSGYTSPSGHS